jgi:Zn/Cd-binding protein ZinT
MSIKDESIKAVKTAETEQQDLEITTFNKNEYEIASCDLDTVKINDTTITYTVDGETESIVIDQIISYKLT